MRRLAAIPVIMLAAAAWGTTAAADIRIGVAGAMTGAQAWFGEQFERGAGMAAADLNANGGVFGQQVEVVVSDDFCDPGSGGRRRKQAGRRRRRLRRRALVLALLDRGIEGV